MKYNSLDTTRVFMPGTSQQAEYQDATIDEFRNNPLIEALPPVLTSNEAAKRLMRLPSYSESDREKSREERLLLTRRITNVRVPLPRMLDLEQRISSMIRWGYVARNPLNPTFWPDTYRTVDALDFEFTYQDAEFVNGGLTLIGIPGIGKTTSLIRTALLYPQIIYHNHYKGRDLTLTQVVYVRLECPNDGALGSLAINFFAYIDRLCGTNYEVDYGQRGKARVSVMLAKMAHVCRTHGIGVLIIDEIQRLSAAKSGGAENMLNFFVQLVNEIGVPVVLVGTYKALPILTGELRQARRGTEEGDMIWHPMKFDGTWDTFLNWIWRYQYTRIYCEKTSALSEALHDVSQGITDFALKAYMLAQKRAITNGAETGKEEITADLIRSVVKDELRSIAPALAALRSKDHDRMRNYEDLYPFDLDVEDETFQQEGSEIENTTPQPLPSNMPPTTSPILMDAPSSSKPSTKPTKGSPEGTSAKPGKIGKNKGKNNTPANGLVATVNQGLDQQISGYEALKEAGIVGHPPRTQE